MNGWRRGVLWGLGLAAVGGCAIGKKPYADDPLIRSQQAVWGDRQKARIMPEESDPEPETPAVPSLDLVGTVP